MLLPAEHHFRLYPCHMISLLSYGKLVWTSCKSVHCLLKKTYQNRSNRGFWYCGCHIRSKNSFSFASIWILPQFCGGVRVGHLFSFVCCPVERLCVLGSVLWCPLQFRHRKDVRFVFTSSCLYDGLCLIYVICVCLRIMMSTTYCVVFFFVLCTLFSLVLWIVHFLFPLRYSLTLIK